MVLTASMSMWRTNHIVNSAARPFTVLVAPTVRQASTDTAMATSVGGADLHLLVLDARTAPTGTTNGEVGNTMVGRLAISDPARAKERPIGNTHLGL